MTDVQQKFRSKVAQQKSATKVYVCHQGNSHPSTVCGKFTDTGKKIQTAKKTIYSAVEEKAVPLLI